MTESFFKLRSEKCSEETVNRLTEQRDKKEASAACEAWKETYCVSCTLHKKQISGAKLWDFTCFVQDLPFKFNLIVNQTTRSMSFTLFDCTESETLQAEGCIVMFLLLKTTQTQSEPSGGPSSVLLLPHFYPSVWKMTVLILIMKTSDKSKI